MIDHLGLSLYCARPDSDHVLHDYATVSDNKTEYDSMYHQLKALLINDGSLLPNSTNTNQQLSLYDLDDLLIQKLIQRLTA